MPSKIFRKEPEVKGNVVTFLCMAIPARGYEDIKLGFSLTIPSGMIMEIRTPEPLKGVYIIRAKHGFGLYNLE